MTTDQWLFYESLIWYSASLLTALTSFINVLIISFTGRKVDRLIRVKFAFYASALTFWSSNVFIFSFTHNPRIAYVCSQLLHFGAIFIPIFLLDFVNYFFKVTGKWVKRELILGYVLSLIFAFIDIFFPRYFISEVIPKRHFPYFLNAGILYGWWVFLFSYLVFSAHFKVFQAYLRVEGVERRRLAFFVFPSFIAYGSCVAYFLPVYDKFFFPYPIGCYGSMILSSVLAYGILKHNLLGVEVIIRKTLVFAGIFSSAFAVFAFVTFLTQDFLSHFIGVPKVFSLALSVLVIVIGYDPIQNFFIVLTDKFLFQKQYDYRKLLRDASAGISHIESLQHLLSLVTHFITMKIRVKNASILMRENKTNRFKFGYARGYTSEEQIRDGFVFDENDPLIDYMKRERAALDYERVKELIESGGPKAGKREVQKRYDYVGIQKRMEGLHAICCVPSFLGNELRNILILGEKKSGEFYTEDDINVLFTIAQESAIAIENARLYDQAVERANELKEINSRLEGAQTDLIRALNETEMANKKLRDTHVQLIHEQKMATLGRLAASVGHEVNNPLTILSMNVSRAILKYRRNPDLKVSEILDVFQKMEQNISRIKAVVNTLTGLLKKSERGKFEPLSLKLILEETLPLVRFQTYLENLSGTEVEFDIPGNTPLIKGDLERLQEVFLNLFINAYHAMVGKRLRKITVTARESPIAPEMVQIEFTDNGCGMPDEVMKKIFSYGFTTKPAGKGSGMGLYMCRYIIELHGGEIKVRSKIGEGTTFVITLPIYREPPTQIQAEGATGL